MDNFIQICANIKLIPDEAFGNFNVTVISDIIRHIDMEFSDSLSIPHFSLNSCIIRYNYFNENPMCSNGENERIIYLRTSDNYWCQWAYQFAHEYCHHIINGTMAGGVSGLMWFEESVCELASMYHLNSLFRTWIQSPELLHLHYAPSFQDYLNDLLALAVEKDSPFAQTPLRELLQQWADSLKELVYHRDYYNAIAARLYPIFLDSPHLWKILFHFGDMRRWHSLEDLFAHLRQTADDSYSCSLEKLENLLFS